MDEKKFFYEENKDCYGIFRQPEKVFNSDVLLVFIHGGFWREKVTTDYLSPLVEQVTNQGFYTWQFEYKRVTPQYSASEILESVSKALQCGEEIALHRELGIKKMILIGHSVGAQLAVYLTKEPPISKMKISKLILLAGVLDFQVMEAVHQSKEQMKNIQENPIQDFLRDEYEMLFSKLSPINQLPLAVPQILIHGNMDIEVPFGLSQHYYERAKALGEEIQLIEDSGGEHYWMVDIQTIHGKNVLSEIVNSTNDI
ncbi:alpha/beta hydrolase family protein [Enterococcus xiangfangensis]|uniref:alpha/beta hydrolase family protein n=1 Tax=Enterococcus xiangfangensis TaxID=1296537 RepID=UPI0010F49E72|nr:alpha/beta hydrolase [Enterococcus xiangfangensis]MBM7711554.1 acetyl esterase/lipase [Enterococcus xiangfangensis]NBK09331.1 alpha/beta hydrolase [Enterococcus asini]